MLVVIVLVVFACAFALLGLGVYYMNTTTSSSPSSPATPGAPAATLAPETIAKAVSAAELKLSTNSAEYLASTTAPNGSWVSVEFQTWTAGFMTGCWRMMYTLTKADKWNVLAEKGTKALTDWQNKTHTHDIGFVIMSSFGNAPSPSAPVLVTAAKNLAKRYVPGIKMIRSWGYDLKDKEIKVIVDNLMNLKLLFVASALPGGDKAWKQMALDHALSSVKHLVRADGSTFHKIIFNADGSTFKGTHQGAADGSTWARGQAWAMYGFTECFEYTKDPRMREAAEKVTKYFTDNLPADNVPVWDFQAPANLQFKDTSAGAIATCAMFKLAKLTGSAALKTKAQAMVETLASAKYTTHTLKSVLCCACPNVPINLANLGYIVADYYYLEALVLAKSA